MVTLRWGFHWHLFPGKFLKNLEMLKCDMLHSRDQIQRKTIHASFNKLSEFSANVSVFPSYHSKPVFAVLGGIPILRKEETNLSQCVTPGIIRKS